MREIKFRGRRVDSGEWRYGGIHISDDGRVFIIIGSFPDKGIGCCFAEVTPETVGQFTGLHDKNGKEIYEWDVVRDGFDSVRTIKWFDNLGYDGGGAMHSGFYFDETYDGIGELNYHNHMTDCEILGNTHENPELLT